MHTTTAAIYDVVKTAALTRMLVVACMLGLCPCVSNCQLPRQQHADASQPVLRLVANHWAPYTTDSLDDGGLASRVVTSVLSRAGYKSTIEYMPWARALMMVAEGQADGVVAIWSTEDRRQRIAFSESYLVNELALFYVANVERVPAIIEELAGKTVGIGRGYDYSDDFLSARYFKKEAANSTLSNLLKLSRRRVDLVLEDPRIVSFNVGAHCAEHPELDLIKSGTGTFMRLPLFFGVSRKRPDAVEIVRRFNDALALLRSDGTIDRMTTSWQFPSEGRACPQKHAAKSTTPERATSSAAIPVSHGER